MDRQPFSRRLARLLGVGALGLASAATGAPPQLASLTPRDGTASDAGFSVRWGAERSALAINPLVAAPREHVVLQADSRVGDRFALDADAGIVQRLDIARWRWTAPAQPGAYTLEITRGDGASMRFTALVTMPRQAMRGGRLNGYLIGDYPQHPARLAIYRPPDGFIEVNARTAQLPLTPRLTLGQFVCKQEATGSRYLVLRERLPLVLEAALDRFARAGIAASGLVVMSGYRTPHYNRQLGDTRFSRHQFGDAADVFIDENGDGMMDDLNADGRHDVDDARLLFQIIDAAQADADWQRFRGGLAAYPPTAYHGAFLHLDTRGVKARW